MREKIERWDLDLLITRPEISLELTDDISTLVLPPQWGADGQCFIRNHLFHSINGYNESHIRWGGDAYDLYIRASAYGAKISSFERSGIYTADHPDDMRCCYLRYKFDTASRNLAYQQAMRFLKKGRRIPRATPGRKMGADKKHHRDIILVRNGQERVWRPAEDDLVY
jgi:hypothetical protein